jgi:hypothetical protein
MTEEDGILIYSHVRNAIADLMLALQAAQQSCTVSEFEQIKRCIGGCLGDLQMDVLEIVNGYHPQLDDLENLSH